MDDLVAHLERLTDPARSEGFLAGAVARISADGTETSFLTGRSAPDPKSSRLSDPALRVRFASVSKLATARAAACLIAGGVLDPDRPVAEILPGFKPSWPPFTVAECLSHTSGLTDHGGYIFSPPETPAAFVERIAGRAVDPLAHGAFFRYANLNYVLIGSVLEAVTGERFDHLIRRIVLDPAGISGGFNWAGVDPQARRHRLPLFQRRGRDFEPTADQPDADWAAPVIWGGRVGHDLEPYEIGRDSLLFSPHAGLRMSVIEAARLARHVAQDDAAGRVQGEIRWQLNADRTNGAYCDGLYTAFGLGLMIHNGHPRIGPAIVGHAGHALGFTGGAWHNPACGTTLAYFLSGSPDLTDGLDDEVFYDDAELPFLNAV